MIIPSDPPKVPSKDIVAAEDAEPTPSDFPPAYEPPQSPGGSNEPLTRPSNYITIFRQNHSIKDSYIIDPSLQELTSFLPALEPNETRKNLSLKSSNGSVKADVSLRSVDPSFVQRATLYAHSQNGSVAVVVHRASSAPTFELSATSKNSSVSVRIPRSFRGVARLHTKCGSIKFSDAVLARRTLFSDIDGTCQCFIGDMSATPLGDIEPDTWPGDCLVADSSNGSVRIHFNDEVEETLFSLLKKNFWGP